MVSGLVLAVLVAAGGYPGPESRADYDINVSLQPDSNMVHGSVEIVFTNGIEFPVDTLWLHLYPNAYRDHTTAFGQDLEAVGRYCFRASPPSEKGWIDLSDWSADGEAVVPSVDGTLAFIPLDDPLQPGESILLCGDFDVHVPKFWSRIGHSGDTYQITQWYPKMCVLDENGWHRARYRWRGEFYSDYGDYSVTLDVPGEFVTAATGCVESTSFSVDSLRRIEVWTAENVHDFVWAASPDYTVRKHTYVYPESLGSCSVNVHMVMLDNSDDHWEEVPAIIDSTLLYYGEWYTPYPYEDLWVVEPAVVSAGGMEYPQFVFSVPDFPFLRILEEVTMHEVGHQWFYGMLGNDEVEEAWLDEGMNTFSELRYMQRRHGFSGNMSRTPNWILELSDQDMSFMTYVTGTLAGEEIPVLSDATEAGDGSHPTGFTYYAKPVLFIRMLQRQMGEEEFNQVMSIYFERFMFHHPHTDDFQAIVEEVTGRSWDEEFNFWLRGTANADVLIKNVTFNADSTTAIIECDIPHSVELDLLFISGEDSLITEASLAPGLNDTVTVSGNWGTAVIDPFLCMPDRAPWNNASPPLGQLKPMFLPIPRPTHHSIWVLPFPSYADHSWRAEIICMSSTIPSYMGGPYTWTASASIPFESESYSAWGASFHMPLYREYRRSIYMSSGISRGYGIGRASLGADYLLSGRVATDPHYRISLDMDLFCVEDTTVYGALNVEEGNAFEFTTCIAAVDRNYRLSWKGALSVLASPEWNDGAYARINGRIELTGRLWGNYLARTRIYAGRIAGDVPVQHFLRPGGGLFAEGIMGAFVPPNGLLSPLEHYFVRSGPALPGYWNSTLRGRAAFSIEQRFPLPLPFFPVELFGGAGWFGDSFGNFSSDDILLNAGITVRIAMLEAIFPLWISDPTGFDKEWEFRWRIGLSPAGFPDLY